MNHRPAKIERKEFARRKSRQGGRRTPIGIGDIGGDKRSGVSSASLDFSRQRLLLKAANKKRKKERARHAPSAPSRRSRIAGDPRPCRKSSSSGTRGSVSYRDRERYTRGAIIRRGRYVGQGLEGGGEGEEDTPRACSAVGEHGDSIIGHVRHIRRRGSRRLNV